MVRLTERPLEAVLAAFASPAPTPAGGSASALASALGASLLLMAATASNLPLEPITTSQQRLADAIDGDASAYAEVIAARKLRRGTEEERAIRREALDRAWRKAIDVPLTIMRLSADALAYARTIAGRVKTALSSDVRIAIALLDAGLRGARICVDANLGALDDQDHAEKVRREIDRLTLQS